jgi:hypothetical protein
LTVEPEKPQRPRAVSAFGVSVGFGVLSALVVLAVALRSPVNSGAPSNQLESQAATAFSLDTVRIDGRARTVASEPAPHGVEIAATSVLSFEGWAVDKPALAAAGGTFAQIDDGSRVTCVYGASRPDVAKVLGSDSFEPSGFACNIEPGVVAKGRHSVSIGIVSADRTHFYLERHQLEVTVR